MAGSKLRLPHRGTKPNEEAASFFSNINVTRKREKVRQKVKLSFLFKYKCYENR